MSEFVFQWPAVLALLALAFPLMWLQARARRKRHAVISSLGGVVEPGRTLRDHLRLVAFVLLVLALARPGYSPRSEPVGRSGRDVVFALDVSRSMLADDVSPSRLEVAKQAIRDALAAMPEQRVGLLVYGGSASILCPLTYDKEFALYMLEQANPRTVDFGGTTLQAAVEKAVDQVFLKGREGAQDLVVLTDGGDQNSNIGKNLELIEEKQVAMLLVGLGNPNRGSMIPIIGEDGEATFIEVEGKPVSTKLEGESLRSLARQSANVDYFEAGVRPFNLGMVYSEYAADKPNAVADVASGIKIYKEAAWMLVAPALILLLWAEFQWAFFRFWKVAAAVFIVCLHIDSSLLRAQGEEPTFASAVQQMEAGVYEEAATQFGQLLASTAETPSTAGKLAAIAFNRGLCLLKSSEARGSEEARFAIGEAYAARDSFLLAKRYRSDFDRAGKRLESTAKWVAELQLKIEEIEEAEMELNEQVAEIVSRLQALQVEQESLRKEIMEMTILDTESAIDRQKKAEAEAQSIGKAMIAVDRTILSQSALLPNAEAMMAEPRNILNEVLDFQYQAVNWLPSLQSWPSAAVAQEGAVAGIVRILELLVGDPDSDSSEWDDMEEDFDYEESDSESQNSSEQMDGDFASSSEMQALPEPNYSAEDILLEEQGNMQFRQQKRAAANADKVKLDY